MTDLARRYITLAHAIEQHNPGFIDGYFGPDEWRLAERWPLAQLAEEADALVQEVAALEEGPRRAFLQAQSGAMQTSIALLRGEPLPFAEEVRRLYDVEAAPVPEARFDEAIALLHALLPGEGPIDAREQAFRARFIVPPERLPGVLDGIVTELGRRTRSRFALPEGESFEVRLVSGQPWGAYNWYLGNYRSRIEINTDLPSYLTALPDLMAHEAYPGHHTEHAIKEHRLFHEGGHAEHSILLINSPECVVSEGIAMRARERVLGDGALRDWLVGELAERSGLTFRRGNLIRCWPLGRLRAAFGRWRAMQPFCCTRRARARRRCLPTSNAIGSPRRTRPVRPSNSSRTPTFAPIPSPTRTAPPC